MGFPKRDKTRLSDQLSLELEDLYVIHYIFCFISKISFENELTYGVMYRKYNALRLG